MWQLRIRANILLTDCSVKLGIGKTYVGCSNVVLFAQIFESKVHQRYM